MKQTILLFLIFISSLSFSQIPVFNNYRGNSIEYDGFKYQDQYYEARPRGLKTFLEENEMDSDLKILLTEKMKNIRTKDLVSNIAGWGLWSAGAGIMLNEALTKNKEGQEFKSSTVFQGLGVVLVGALLKEFIRPKKRHYNNFVNTFNKKQSEKIRFEVVLNYEKNMNFGLAINF
jgi:hypothetical protein|tara:strand:+ start:561 stop:1085 length:525 start_codon:yes stop_codon:yes gene_type:complete